MLSSDNIECVYSLHNVLVTGLTALRSEVCILETSNLFIYFTLRWILGNR
jgi:hypothetical protein